MLLASASMLLAVIITATLRSHHHHQLPNNNSSFTDLTTNASQLLRSNGFNFIATFLHISPDLFLSTPQTTIFAIPDVAISSLSLPPYMTKHLLAYHISPEKLAIEDLFKKTPNTCLPTLIQHETVSITKNDYKRLFMFGGIGRNMISRSMNIWELDVKGRRWMEMPSVPEMMCKKLGSVCYHNYEHIYYFWHQGMICVWCYTWPEVLYYKVSRRTWHWLPKSPSLPDKWSCGFRWFSFVPELYGYV